MLLSSKINVAVIPLIGRFLSHSHSLLTNLAKKAKMRKLIFQILVSVDGFFEGPGKEIDWHNVDAEFDKYALDLISRVDLMLFGRVTYELMAGYWPTKQARTEDPLVAAAMNKSEKIVFSSTLKQVDWEHTRLVKTNAADEVRRLKSLPGKEIVIFGSSDLAASLIENDLIDEMHIIVNPILIGDGKQLLKGIDHRISLELSSVRTFMNGNVLMVYQPVRKEK